MPLQWSRDTQYDGIDMSVIYVVDSKQCCSYSVVIVFQAQKVYEQGATLGLFLSAWQRSLYNVDRLQSRPWWTIEQTRSTSSFKVRSP